MIDKEREGTNERTYTASEKIVKAKQLKKQGMTSNQVAEALNCTATYVRHIWNYKHNISVQEAKSRYKSLL
jgi:CRISPR/Cas system CSM-associated protein Csm2 small subunit